MSEQNLKIGISATVEADVTEKDTAKSMGSGALDVYATPSMIALMEHAAMTAVQSRLVEGQGTVGTALSIKHMAATPVGMKVKARAELIEIDGRRLVFKIEAYDSVDKIGEGAHERFIIDNERFRGKVYQKL